MTIRGASFASDTRIVIGGAACTDVKRDSASQLSCTTGGANFVEGTVDVVVTTAVGTATLPAAFSYRCLWQTMHTMQQSCGAAPAPAAPAQQISSWITQFQGGDGFVPDGGGSTNMADTSDFVLGTQSAWLQTTGNRIPRTVARLNGPPIDLNGTMLKVWLKVDSMTHVSDLDIVLGTGADQFVFPLRSAQSQQWITDGDWVSFAIAWNRDSYTVFNHPDRGAITDIAVRITDDGTGNPVRLHVNGLGLVPEPSEQFPDGVLSYTFDDNFTPVTDTAAPILAAHNVPATAYVIVDTVGKRDRLTLDDLHNLAGAGWDIAVHAATDIDHAAHYTSLTPSQVETDMVTARAWLIKNGFGGYNHCAYPSGLFDDNVLSLARTYFTSCRTIFTRGKETFPPSDAEKLKVFYVVNGTPLPVVEAAVDDARVNHEWLILVFHRIVPAPQVSTEWPTADFAALADYVAASGIRVETVNSVLAM